MNYLGFLLNESQDYIEEHELDGLLHEWLLDKKTRDEVDGAYDRSDRLKFGLTFKHVINRITTASLAKHTFENTRSALQKTVEDCDSPKDIAFLRRDMQAGKVLMRRMIEKHPDPDERKQAKIHLAWLEREYAAMLTARLKKIKTAG